MANILFSRQIVILIVEDEPLVRMMVVSLVEDAGFDALEAGNADEAVRILESRSDVQIVLTDIDMPGSMDGIRLSAVIRLRWPHIEIVLASGRHRITARELPAGSVFLQKPYPDEKLVATLQRLVA